MKFKNIRSRLNLWFFLVALLPLTLVLITAYLQEVNTFKKAAFDRILAVRDLKVMQIENWKAERYGDINLLATNIDVIQSCTDQSLDKPAALEKRTLSALMRRLANYTVYNEILLISAETGKIISATNPALVGADRSTNSYFTTPLQTGNAFIKDVYDATTTTTTTTLTFSAPVFAQDDEDQIIGVVVARINLEKSLYTLLLNNEGMGSSGETLLVNKNAITITPLRWQQDALLKLQIDADPAVLAAQGNTGIIETLDYRGEKVLAAYTYIPNPGWGGVAKQDLAELYAPTKKLFRLYLKIYLLTMTLTYLIALCVARNISRPLSSIVEVADQISRGELTRRNTVQRADEIGRLSTALDTMADALASRIMLREDRAKILACIVASENTEFFGGNSLKELMRATSSELGSFYLQEPDQDIFTPVAVHGLPKELLEQVKRPDPQGELGRAIASGKTNHIKDISTETFARFEMLAGEQQPQEILIIPLQVQNKTVAIITLGATGNYTPYHLELIRTVPGHLSGGLASLLSAYRIKKLAATLTEANNELQQNKVELQVQSKQLQAQNVTLASQKDGLAQRTHELKDRVAEAAQLNGALVNLLEDLEDSHKQLEATAKQLTYANKELEGFSYSVSHDLRAPLRHMSGFANLLAKQAADSLDDKCKHYLEILLESSEKMGQLIDDLLNYSRTGRADLKKQQVNSDELVQQVIKELKKYQPGRKIDWQVEQLPPAFADPALLRVIWTNILGNAVKFTGNEAKAIIEIGSKPGANNDTVYFVKDNGAGFDMSYKEKLFGVFQRLHRDSEFEGTGIGLATVQRILTRHGGQIWAEGAIDEGATFFFTLPKNI